MKEAVLISGCDSGFGKILVEKLEKLNRFLIFAGVFTDQGKALYADRPGVVAVPLDVTSDASVANALDIVRRELVANGAVLYGLVNNAGVLTRPAPTEWQDPSNYERMLAVNIVGVVRLTNACLPLLRESQGRIVIVGSIAGRNGLALNSAYCASKHAVLGYAEVLRRDMLPWRVRVSVIEPGIFSQTGLYHDWQTGLDANWKTLNPEVKKQYGDHYYKGIREAMGMVIKGLSNGNPESVPDMMVEALTAAKPLRRYRPGRDSSTIFRALPLLPDHWVDTILTRPMGPPLFPGNVTKRTESHELYANDTTASIVASSLIMFSGIGVYATAKRLFSRL